MVKWTSVWAQEAEKTSKTKWKLTYGTPCMFCNIYLFELIVCKFNYSSFLFIILFPKCQVIVQCQTLYFSAKNCYLFHIFMAVYIASDKFPCWGQSKANTNVFSGFQLSAASLWHVFTPRKLAARRRSSSRKLANTSQTPAAPMGTHSGQNYF